MPAELSVILRNPCPVAGCGRSFAFKSECDRHKAIDHGITSEQPNSDQRPHQANNATSTNTPEPPPPPSDPSLFPCTICGDPYSDSYEMRLHKAKKDDHEYCWDCDLDIGKGTDKYLWEKVVRHQACSPKHIVCPVCGKEFRLLQFAKDHILSFHRKVFRPMCMGCDQMFASGQRVWDHMAPLGVCPGPKEAEKPTTSGEDEYARSLKALKDNLAKKFPGK